MTSSVRDNPDRNRYEIFAGDTLAGFTAYELSPGQIAFTHTETFAEFAGQGLAKLLVTEALDDVRRRGLAVLPFCPYVRKFIARHPQTYADLVPETARHQFGLVPTVH